MKTVTAKRLAALEHDLRRASLIRRQQLASRRVREQMWSMGDPTGIDLLTEAIFQAPPAFDPQPPGPRTVDERIEQILREVRQIIAEHGRPAEPA